MQNFGFVLLFQIFAECFVEDLVFLGHSFGGVGHEDFLYYRNHSFHLIPFTDSLFFVGIKKIGDGGLVLEILNLREMEQ